MEYSQVILNFMSNQNTSGYKLAQKTGISESLFSKWKTKPTSDISAITLTKIADYFSISIDSLIGIEKDKKITPTSDDVEDEAEIMEFAKKLYSVLLDFGYIEEEQTLTDKQISFLRSHFNTLALFFSDN